MANETLLWKHFPNLTKRLRGLLNNAKAENRDFLKLFMTLRTEDRAILTFREIHNLHHYAQRAASLDGDFAELGVFRGGGAKLIHSAAPRKKLYLFDTFEGMPETDPSKDLHKKGDFSETSAASVSSYLTAGSPNPENIQIVKGFFPASAAKLDAIANFAFVHLDVDIYESTLEGLKFFYPRLSPGGVLISHDYNAISCPGVKLAFDEYFAKSDQEVIPLWDCQCLVIKR